MKIKHRINKYLRKHNIRFGYNVLVNLNMILFHQAEREKHLSYGKNNPEITFYVIRSSSHEEGLLSLFFSVLREIEYASAKGWIPIIDMKNYTNQYSTDTEGIPSNIWEYYFTQPTDYSLEEVYKSKNIVLSGWTNKKKESALFNFKYNDLINQERFKFMQKNCIRLSKYTLLELEKYSPLLQEKKTLGLFFRGTDYRAFHPQGHPVQPELEVVIKKVTQFLEKYEIDSIFLVTEDGEIAKTMKERFKKYSIIDIEQGYIKTYDGKDYLHKYLNENTYERGMNYLIKMLLLSQCTYFIGGITNGSLFSLLVNENSYQDKYIFELGMY